MGEDSPLAMSMMLRYFSLLAVRVGSSMVASDGGRPSRASRSTARLLRLEMDESTAQIAITTAAKTASGTRSAQIEEAANNMDVSSIL